MMKRFTSLFWNHGWEEPTGFTWLLLGIAAMALVVSGIVARERVVGERDALACRQRGLDAVAVPGFSLHMTCVPRAGHGVDTVYVRVQP